MSHNTFGHLFRVTTWGESHGPAIGCVVDGCPPGLPLSEGDIQPWLDRRRPGTSRFVTQRREADQVRILSGVYEGRTTGTPIALMIDNTDQRSRDYGEIARQFRPGHADFAYQAKYGWRDPRGGGRASARETAMRVAAGAVARVVLGAGVTLRAGVVQVGDLAADPARFDWSDTDNPFFGPDAAVLPAWEAKLDAARKAGSSVGAIVQVEALGAPAGWGAPVYGKLDAELAGALMSINAVKGVEIGAGFAAAAMDGREAGDEMRAGGGRAAVPLQPRGRGAGRDLHRPADRGAPGAQADLVDRHAAPLAGRGGGGGGGRHPRPPRPLRGPARPAGGRGHGGLRAGRRQAAPPRPDGALSRPAQA